jgi:hypothetical protein
MSYCQVFISAEIRPQGLYILKHLLSSMDLAIIFLRPWKDEFRR